MTGFDMEILTLRRREDPDEFQMMGSMQWGCLLCSCMYDVTS